MKEVEGALEKKKSRFYIKKKTIKNISYFNFNKVIRIFEISGEIVTDCTNRTIDHHNKW